MKFTLSLCLALAGVLTAHAQGSRPDGGQRGGDRTDRAIVSHTPRGGDARDHRHHHHHSPRVRVSVGYGAGNFGYYRGTGYGYRAYRDFGYAAYAPYPGYSYRPSYSYYGGYGADYPYYGTSGYYGAPSSATGGLLLGALAGGIIGQNSGDLGHNGWRGAAWGAGLGWVLGSVAEANRRVVAYEQPPVVVPSTPTVAAPTAQPTSTAAQPVTIINNYYNTTTPMSGANSLFGR